MPSKYAFHTNNYSRATVKGELPVASFLVNFLIECGVGYMAFVACNREVLIQRQNLVLTDLPLFLPCQVGDFALAMTMARQPDAAQHILIETLLKKSLKPS